MNIFTHCSKTHICEVRHWPDTDLKGVLSGSGQESVPTIHFIHTRPTCLYGCGFITGHWEGPPLNCSHKVGCTELPKASRCWTLQSSSHWNKGTKASTRKTPQNIIRFHQTLHLAQHSQTSTNIIMSLVHYSTASDSLHCTCWYMALMQLLNHCCWAFLKAIEKTVDL